MVLIWTQFGVKHKNVNVKCKVRVMHRGDSSGSSSSAVSTFLSFVLSHEDYFHYIEPLFKSYSLVFSYADVAASFCIIEYII